MTAPSKPYTLTFTEHPEYLYAELKGETISADIIRQYIEEIIAKCEEIKKDSILLYRDVPTVLSGGEVYFTVNESLNALAGKKVAVVNPHAEIKEVIDFGMTVGQNRGGNYQSFSTTAEAETWLLEG